MASGSCRDAMSVGYLQLPLKQITTYQQSAGKLPQRRFLLAIQARWRRKNGSISKAPSNSSSAAGSGTTIWIPLIGGPLPG